MAVNNALPIFTNAVQPIKRTNYVTYSGEHNYNHVRYTDDVALLATTEDNLQQLVNEFPKKVCLHIY